MKTLILLASFFFASAAAADCMYNGESYPTGTVIGPLVCQPDGTWQRR
ncbi:hypothetical protein LPB19_01320 [Marinobacter salinisoli]|uniref:Uncharacterized protein n=1 Tax=Marinobacter salinisoli TaxID=2769486 RepID=A0ABX7MRU9_9GAMM|nr:hypothetical protein [Marinobacter salinisoli]QSP95091.1 hypothetical protein LPB19_01320 [Marinobacter salinisoli]